MAVQVKTVDPNGSQKAVVAVHDRVASGKEFALFSHLLAVMAIGAVPVMDEFAPNGSQLFKLIDPERLTRRAQEIVREAMYIAQSENWIVEADDIDAIYEDASGRVTGFRDAVQATKPAAPSFPGAFTTSDDIPF